VFVCVRVCRHLSKRARRSTEVAAFDRSRGDRRKARSGLFQDRFHKRQTALGENI